MDSHFLGWVAWMRTAGRPMTTINLRTYHVSRAARELAVTLELATVDHLAAWLGAQHWAPATRRSYRASLVQYFRFLQRSGVRLDNPAELLPSVRVPRGVPRPAPDDVLRAALEAADPRARLAMLLAGQCGLRRGEIARLHTRDVESDLLGLTLRVTGKGGHTRLVPVPTDDQYGLVFLLRRLPAGWAFPSSVGDHLTPEHMGRIVSRALPTGWTCHTLRHRFATTTYRATRDIRATQELLGHARPETTAIYTQIAVNDLRAAVQTAALLRAVPDA
jgi:site-specific recombinase XerD